MTAIMKITDSSARPGDPTWLDVHRVEPARRINPSIALSIEIVEDRAGFQALEPEWNTLHEKAGRRHHLAFQSHAWLSEWCAAFALDAPDASTRLAIAVIRQGDTACLICPFAVQRRYGVSRLIWMGQPASQYGDVLIDPERASTIEIAVAFNRVLAHVAPDIVDLRRVRSDSAITPFLKARGGSVIAENTAPFVDVAKVSSAEHYAARFSTKARKNRRRLRRRLEEKGAVRFEILPPGDAASAAMRLGLDFKRDWLVRRGEICSALCDGKLHDLLITAARRHDSNFKPFVSVMYCGDEEISVQFGIVTDGRLALHMIAYKPAWEKAGAGVLHIEETITHCIEQGIRELDFLGPDAPYKRVWSDDAVAMDDYVLAETLTGRLVQKTVLGRNRERFKQLLSRLPHAVRCQIARRLQHRTTR
jgi:CelD/BcsL family acetyltransferase involved in cellulose biosynthesis